MSLHISSRTVWRLVGFTATMAALAIYAWLHP